MRNLGSKDPPKDPLAQRLKSFFPFARERPWGQAGKAEL